MTLKAILFDKDGTLFDFGATWNNWTLSVIEHYAEGSANLAQHIANTIGFDLSNHEFLPSSPIIAGTNREAAELVASALTDADVDQVEEFLAVSAASAPLAPVVPLAPYLQALRAAGYLLGVVTNDTERNAHVHLDAAGAEGLFDFVAGHDSGIGAKPDPDPLLAFAQQFDLGATQVAMVGDSTHDLIAGRRAGMTTVGVLTGMASRSVLAEHADVVLADIGALPNWLKTR